ncbi:ABC transporter substrate-binding protein [Priestia filamentosa]|uniref:ABC transporter substrate-binding protein n=1 Tax=Priestia filamentosa TaxID=1402861 RepID=UPI0003173E25|nr:ABC transporter substrate-binding protein [Priestia filamentosa]
MKKLYMLLFAVVLVLSACNSGGNDNSSTKNDSASVQQDKVYPVSIEDARGEKVKLEKQPKKVVSLIPSNTEILYNIGAGKQVVGVTDNDTYPKEVKEKESVGGMEPNVEKIISLNPDLVLAHASTMASGSDLYKQLEDAGIKVFVVKDAQTFDATYQSIETIGALTGHVEKAEETIADMKESVKEITDKAKEVKDKKKVWVEISSDLYTTGEGTFMNEMLTLIGAENVAKDQEGWVQLSKEDVVALNPDVILTTYGAADKNAVANIKKRPGFEAVKAVETNSITDLNSDEVTRPGPRLVNGLEDMAKAVYPEVYK